LDTGKKDNMIFGIHPIEEALRSGKKLDRLYIRSGRKSKPITDLLHLAKSQGVDVRFEPYERLTARVQKMQNRFCTPGDVASHQGVVGIMATYAYVAFEELLSRIQQHHEPPFLLVLDNIQDPHNLGAILRSAECAGVHGVIIPKHKSVGITSTVAKISAGATAYISVCRVTNLASAIKALKKHALWIVGTSHTAQRRYDTVDFTMPVAIVIGNEEKGIRKLVAEKCDMVVSIPLCGRISSLNASVSSAIVMFEVRRQRNKKC
jgi:23S rRNA (guanosine2251-2'-O)-methyltransferase